jgi:hypothetical protein
MNGDTMKKILLIIMIIVFALTGCSPALDEPVSNDDPITPQVSDYLPVPEDANLVRDVVYLDSVDLLTMESFPLQFSLVFKGNLPTPCHQFRIAAEPPDTENKIVIDVYSVTDPNKACVLMLEPFEINFPLGDYPQGHYTVWVNGEQAVEFDG